MLSKTIARMSPQEKSELKREKNKLNYLSFPEDIGAHGTLLAFKEYSYSTRDAGITIGTAKAEISDSILLPLPQALLEGSSIKVGATELGHMGNAAASIAADAKATAGSAASGKEFAQNFADKLLTTDRLRELAGGAAVQLIKEGVSALPGGQGLQKGVEAGLGATTNNFQALTFEGVNLRSYIFDWTFAPRTRNETNNLKKIIQTIRRNIHPSYSKINLLGIENATGRAFLNYPKVCFISILGSNTLLLKPTMISQFQVNYAGGGELAFLEGGDPAVVQCNMTVSEMQIWTAEDYANDPPTTLRPQLLGSPGDLLM